MSTGDSRSYFDQQTDETDHGGSVIPFADLDSYEIASGLFFRPFFAQNISLNFVTFPPDSGFPAHVHPEEQVSIVQEGSMEITIGDHAFVVSRGDVIHFPPNVAHSGRDPAADRWWFDA